MTKWFLIVFILTGFQQNGKYTPGYEKYEVPMPSPRVCNALAFSTRDYDHYRDVYAFCEQRYTPKNFEE